MVAQMISSVVHWFEGLLSQDRRRSKRNVAPELVAFYWDGAAPVAHGIRDISSTGLYLLTEGRWYPGTLVVMTLQRTGSGVASKEHCIAVEAKVIRQGKDGVALAFVLPEKMDSSGQRVLMPTAADRKTFDKFVQQFQILKSGEMETNPAAKNVED